jgi:hypothetical protein
MIETSSATVGLPFDLFYVGFQTRRFVIGCRHYEFLVTNNCGGPSKNLCFSLAISRSPLKRGFIPTFRLFYL